MNGHDIIIGLTVLVLLGFQIYITIKTFAKLKALKAIFNGIFFFGSNKNISVRKIYIPIEEVDDFSSSLCQELDYSERRNHSDIEISVLIFIGDKSSVFCTIIETINTYLLRNKGAISDFLLIKDIVERNCDAKHDEVTTQIPLPLYLGLMGTMAGILIGLGYISLGGGGFQSFISSPEQSIGVLMGGVAIAMIASFFGILFTTAGSWKSKSVTAEVEVQKNQLYSWLQSELLPSLASNAANSLQLLQQNLLKFNDVFSTNVNRMDSSLAGLGETYQQQADMLEMMIQLDVNKTASANVKVLKELQVCTDKLSQFNDYIYRSTEYLDNVRALNSKLDDSFERTRSIEKMGQFFEDEINAIAHRKGLVQTTIVDIDDALRQACTELGHNASEQIKILSTSMVQQQDILLSALREQEESFKEKISYAGDVLQALSHLGEIGSSITGLKDEMNKQNELFTSSLKQILSRAHKRFDETERVKPLSDESVIEYDEKDRNSSHKIALWAIAALLFLLIGAISGSTYFILDKFDSKPKGDDVSYVINQDSKAVGVVE
ncbi:MAG: hypothetical protein ACRCUJ_09065 [Phocaeicola sp.]